MNPQKTFLEEILDESFEETFDQLQEEFLEEFKAKLLEVIFRGNHEVISKTLFRKIHRGISISAYFKDAKMSLWSVLEGISLGILNGISAVNSGKNQGQILEKSEIEFCDKFLIVFMEGFWKIFR